MEGGKTSFEGNQLSVQTFKVSVFNHENMHTQPKTALAYFLSWGEFRHMRSDLAQIPASASRGSSFTPRYVTFTK